MTKTKRIMRNILLLAGMSALMGINCMGVLQRELSVLFATEAESLLIRDSILGNLIGPETLAALLF